ncbi:aminodeoxychorismate synthase component I [Eilatimonas milleporae]|uniref:Probable branched-chain-amino-acid aminotransferase n=1 Tax=Eilatimonas milleporae TaxID=911205 RepID=A0A3M0BYI8_9PROT|nr:aminodeoxychorismate synthase component I [Eilatimonas milleporae]RMB02674.1 para-aminobenzoate synthetase/4-amino-4-deoxychorismate lyase [Eilatimonas milleporae]
MTAFSLRRAPLVLLDDCQSARVDGQQAGGRRERESGLLFSDPAHILEARGLDAIPDALNRIDALVAEGHWLAGWLSYECAAAWEPRVRRAIEDSAAKAGRPPYAREPLIWMMAVRAPHRVDTEKLLHEAERGSRRRAGLSLGTPPLSADGYKSRFAALKDFIAAGDVYQVNFTMALDAAVTGDPIALYGEIRQHQLAPYGAYIDTGDWRVLSASPELFLERRNGGIRACPMKGTARRGDSGAEDAALAHALAADSKSQAENLMIVDLLRNDLSRVAEPGSVAVPRLYEVSAYPTLFQMTSTVTADLKPDLPPSDLIRAAFPCGSVTGAPKIRAMEIIAGQENGPRGVYCGAIGYFGPEGRMTLNVPIRTFVLGADGRGRLGIGSGIVADSRARDEYDECLLKADFARRASVADGSDTSGGTDKPDTGKQDPEKQNKDKQNTGKQDAPPRFRAGTALIETMRLDPDGHIPRRDRHLARLAASARALGMISDSATMENRVENQVENRIARHVAALGARRHTRRMRVLLGPGGTVSVTSKPLDGTPDGGKADTPLPAVAIAGDPLDHRAPQRRHKTTDRAIYDIAARKAREDNLADILFFNTDGLLAEGAISTVFIVRDGLWRTPRISDGALPGVLRAELIAQADPPIEETAITHDMLRQADRVFIGNSVRGLREVTLREEIVALPAIRGASEMTTDRTNREDD